ncbi:MAG: GspH/FimT family pseudopilin [Mariprofundus sp.]
MRMYPNPTPNDEHRQAGVFGGLRPGLNQRGFTLVEVMMVIAIVGLMFSVAVPAFSSWRESQGVKNAQRTLMGHMKQARMLALAENRSVSITFTATSYVFDADTSGTCGAICRKEIINLAQFSGKLSLKPTITRTFTSRGTANSGTVTFTAGSAQQKITINVIGRVY